MTTLQRIIQYGAIALALLLTVSIIGGIFQFAGWLGGLATNDAVLETTKTYTVTGSITCLDICVNAADLKIVQTDRFSVASNLRYLSVTENDGVLRIQEEKKFTGSYNSATVTLFIPKGITFKKASILNGAGIFTAENLCAEHLVLELGAGQVNIKNLVVNNQASIDGGAGEINISGGQICDLELDMGVGQLNLTSALQGKSELNLGVGESNITLIGSNLDYGLEIEKGLGSITVDGKRVADYESQGQHKIEINGGVGSVHVEFQ